MYEEYFGITEKPFSIAPDPRYLYMSDGHREALAHLMYGLANNGGFVLLTGEVGVGKTTVSRRLLQKVPENMEVAFILNPKVSVAELLATICDELSIGYPPGNSSIKVFLDRINNYLLNAHAQGKNILLIIDEAQNLDNDLLEQVRLLTNLETNQRKLLQIILVGQPELRERLDSPDLRQLTQRITARYHLGPLLKEETRAYILHRLRIAGIKEQVFSVAALGQLYELSQGIPRLINVLCDRALLGAYVQGLNMVDEATVLRAGQEVFGQKKRTQKGLTRQRLRLAVLCIVLIVAGGAALATTWLRNSSQPVEIRTTALPKDQPDISAATKPAETAIEKTPEISQPEQTPLSATLDWPSDQPVAVAKESAFSALFDCWRLTYRRENGDVCRYAESQGLRCLNQEDGVNGLLRLNRPAVLTLVDDGGKEYFAALTAMRGEIACFIMGNEARMVQIDKLGSRWSGHYSLFWRPPPGYVDSIHPGHTGPVVQWLAEQFARIDQRPLSAEKIFVYGESLVRRVKEFQFKEGILPDGIAGAHTLILLNNAIESDEPRLTEEKEAP